MLISYTKPKLHVSGLNAQGSCTDETTAHTQLCRSPSGEARTEGLCTLPRPTSSFAQLSGRTHFSVVEGTSCCVSDSPGSRVPYGQRSQSWILSWSFMIQTVSPDQFLVKFQTVRLLWESNPCQGTAERRTPAPSPSKVKSTEEISWDRAQAHKSHVHRHRPRESTLSCCTCVRSAVKSASERTKEC